MSDHSTEHNQHQDDTADLLDGIRPGSSVRVNGQSIEHEGAEFSLAEAQAAARLARSR